MRTLSPVKPVPICKRTTLSRVSNLALFGAGCSLSLAGVSTWEALHDSTDVSSSAGMTSTSLSTFSPNLLTPRIDHLGVQERIARIQSRSLKGDTKRRMLALALSMVDLTTLEGKDSDGKVEQLCRKALQPMPGRTDIPTVATVCVYPPFVRLAKTILKGSTVKVASVATSFPSGLAPLSQRVEETRYAVGEGADEIDMVISRGAFLRGEYGLVADEISAVKEACGDAHLKVILETGELSTLENVRKASDLAILAGADFIKTSTGKVQPAATLEVTYVMLQAIHDHYRKTGTMIGMKPAGGIATTKLALHYLVLLQEVLGPNWMTPDLFRFGASKLVNDLLMQIVTQEQGAYQSGDYFTKD